MEDEEKISVWKLIVSSAMLIGGLLMAHYNVSWFQNGAVQLAWYVIAYLPVGLKVMREAWEWMLKGDFFSEFMLMTIATIGAFAIGEYPEGVAVMLLYCIGEALQDRAVDHARNNIKALVAFRPDRAEVERNGVLTTVEPQDVKVGETIEVKAGERVPLDGTLTGPDAAFNTAALTGESMPRMIASGKEVLAGMIAADTTVRIRVSRPAKDSAISRILNMVEDATERKAPTELFIRKFAHVYTPVVIILAALTVLLPWLYGLIATGFHYEFSEWFRRALIFLVISCPCALVISIPLGYFGGIGAASKRGILFKGSNYLDAITEVDAVVFDKTGTLTKGEFAVQMVSGLSEEDLKTVSRIELSSTHPIARAINKCCPVSEPLEAKTIAGYGMESGEWVVGTLRLLDKKGISYPENLRQVPETIVACAKGGQFKGYILMADTLKPDARDAIRLLNKHTEILSGDKQALVDKVAQQVGADKGYGDLMPQDKVAHIESLRKNGHKVAFVGDGINDAPVLALSDVGIAMGALGSDMAVETADIILQTDQPSKVAEAVTIGKRTRKIVYENIVLALGIKFLVMVLGLLGVATLWEAVFADSGVALLAVLNATRIFFIPNKKGNKKV